MTFTYRIIIEESTFDGFPNPQSLSDWLANLNYYFDRYRISEECRV